MTRRFAFAGAALALIALSWLLLREGTPPGTVVLTDEGFRPRVVTIAAGETVTFRNDSGKYFWPASDFHPTHALYADFDAKEPLAPGETYAYAFAEPGTYPFHDHLAAYFSGIVRVAGEDGIVPDDCAERGGDFACWQNDLLGILAEQGVDAAYDRVAELYAADPSFSGSCHSLAHNLGLSSYQLYLADPASVASPKAVACASGFYHGFMEGFIGASGDMQAAARICDEVGGAVAASSPDARYQCYHGIGHGAMETAVADSGEFRSVDEAVDAAVLMCETASEGAEERYRCVSGAYNAIANFYINGAYGLSSDDGEAFELCARQPAEHKEACYGNMNSVAMHLAGDDFSKAVRHILSIPDREHIAKSVEYLSGMNALHALNHGDAATLVASCRALPGAYLAPCIAGLAHGFLEHGEPGREYEAALSFCADAPLTAPEKDACYRKAAGSLEGWYSAEKAREICAAAPGEARAYCEK